MFAREGFAYRGGKVASRRGFQSGSGGRWLEPWTSWDSRNPAAAVHSAPLSVLNTRSD